MGQTACSGRQRYREDSQLDTFHDLALLPPEVAVQVLSHLDATDLCLASCVNEMWHGLANVELLWKQLCIRRWSHVSAYHNGFTECHSYKELYMYLDNGTLTFKADPHEGISYLVREGILDDDANSVAAFIHYTNALSWKSLQKFLKDRPEVLHQLVPLHDYSDTGLPDALRKFFSHIPAPNERGWFLEQLLDLFCHRYLQCNPQSAYSKDTVYIVCYSLILLSVDLTSPCIKNKMSKREFIRNLRRATTGLDSETLGHMYDNVYLCGHVATQYC